MSLERYFSDRLLKEAFTEQSEEDTKRGEGLGTRKEEPAQEGEGAPSLAQEDRGSQEECL